MRAQSSLIRASRRTNLVRRSRNPASSRSIQISQAPTTETPVTGSDAFGSFNPTSDPADARFEVLGAPYSLLSVSLSASQKLYTRRGTLVAISGKAENAQSTLSLLSPLKRAPLGIPFLYQKITSTTPLTALVSTKSPITSLSVIHLNGTVDWMLTSRKALLAWTGHTLSLYPTTNTGMSLAHWGNTQVTGRGLVALAGNGQIYQVTLKAGEEYVAHPGNVLAYTVTQNPPLPYRFKSSSLRFQVPSMGLGGLLSRIKFLEAVRDSAFTKAVGRCFYSLRTMTRRTIWGDRLFLQFKGPTTLLLSSRASRISDILTTRDINEIADAPVGESRKAVTLLTTPNQEEIVPKPKDIPTALSVASVGNDGKVSFEKVETLEEPKK